MEWHIFVRKASLTMSRFQIITYHCDHIQHYLLYAIYYLLGLLLIILVSMVGVSLHRLSGADVPACPPPWWQEPPALSCVDFSVGVGRATHLREEVHSFDRQR